MTLNEILTAILTSFPFLSADTMLKIADLIEPLSPEMKAMGDAELLDQLISETDRQICPLCAGNYAADDMEQWTSIGDHGHCSDCHRRWQEGTA